MNITDIKMWFNGYRKVNCCLCGQEVYCTKTRYISVKIWNDFTCNTCRDRGFWNRNPDGKKPDPRDYDISGSIGSEMAYIEDCRTWERLNKEKDN